MIGIVYRGGLVRAAIETPAGRYVGRYPQQLGGRSEAPYIASLALQVGGIAEAVLPAGRADVLSASVAYEVEPARSWRRGAQQAYAYAAQTGTTPAIALFGPADYEEIYRQVRDRMPGGLQLWRWSGTCWEHITSRRAARVRRVWTKAAA